MGNIEKTSTKINPFSLNDIAYDQEILPIPKNYSEQAVSYVNFEEIIANNNKAKYFDAPVLQKFSISSEVDTNSMSLDEIIKYYEIKDGEKESVYKTKWADVSIYDSNGEVRKDLVEAYNSRNKKIVKERYGINLSDKDPQTGLFLNPMMKEYTQNGYIYGRGVLGKFGINDAVDLVLTTKDMQGVEHTLTIRRPKDPGKPLAVPGGVVDYTGFDTQEELEEAASREGFEEVGLRLPEGIEIKKVGSYLVADPRNTALSFMGTTVFRAEVSWDEAQRILMDWKNFKLSKKSTEEVEAEEVEFRPTSGSQSILNGTDQFFASHKKIIAAR